MNLHPDPACAPIPVKIVIPGSLATRSQRINPWIPADGPAATICGTAAGYEFREAALRPAQQMYRVLTGRERKRHFGLIRLNPERPHPTVPKSMGGSTTGLIHPRELRRLTTSEIKALSSFPDGLELRGSYRERWARIGNSVPPLLMRAIARHLRERVLDGAAGRPTSVRLRDGTGG